MGKAGRYAVHARVASTDVSKFALEVGDRKLAAGTPSTGSYDKFQSVVLGEITLAEGKATLTVVPDSGAWKAFNLRHLILKPLD